MTASDKDLYTTDLDSDTIGDYTYRGGNAVETISDKDEHWGSATSPASAPGTRHP